MAARRGLLASLGLGLAAGCGAADDEASPERRDGQSLTRPSAAVKETLAGGLIAELPQFGTLTWRCDGRRFAVRLKRPKPITSIDATVRNDGKVIARNRRVNRSYETPLAEVGEQTWRMVWHHVPAEKRATVRLRFARSTSGDCFVRTARTSVTTDPSN